MVEVHLLYGFLLKEERDFYLLIKDEVQRQEQKSYGIF
jgi:hypothetical protein